VGRTVVVVCEYDNEIRANRRKEAISLFIFIVLTVSS
jgi:hypothetical protein